jgi:hypothetical protein
MVIKNYTTTDLQSAIYKVIDFVTAAHGTEVIIFEIQYFSTVCVVLN